MLLTIHAAFATASHAVGSHCRHRHRGWVIEHPQPIEPHRWTSPAPGLAPLDASTRELLQRLRGRRPPRNRRRGTFLLAAVLVLHALLMLALWHEMRPRPPRPQVVHVQLHDALQVRFVQRASTHAPAPPPMDLRAPPERPRPVREPVRHDAMAVHMDTPAPAASVAPAPRLYDRRGTPLVPAQAASAPSVPGYVQRKPTGDMQVMQHTSPIDYKATRFEQYFPPPGENAAQAGLRHVLSPLLKKHDVNLPRGVHLKCSLLTGCQDPPAPPPPNDGDERLSMAPTPLAADPHAKPPPSLKSCIAAYRANGPLPYGCPVDTPAKAVDADIRECIALFRAGKRLKTWCPADTARRAAAQAVSSGAGPARAGSAGAGSQD